MAQHYRVEIAPAAYEQLHEIFSYVREQSRQAAGDTIARILTEPGRAGRDAVAISCRRAEPEYWKWRPPLRRPPLSRLFRVDDANLLVSVIDVRRDSRRQPRRFE
ncbi:MAG TPA: hypothetical protein VER17_16690 [Tepidisphaeraceae bacterium]|nr:hypothetical protein [Tepidisphaeraceae bacterium]